MLLVLGYSLVSYASSVMDYALLKDFTVKNMIIRVVLDAQTNLTLSHTVMSVPGCTTFLLLSGDMLQYCHISTVELSKILGTLVTA